MPSTSRMAIPYPVAADANNVPADMLAMATLLDTLAAIYSETTFAGRAAAGKAGRIWRGTDTRRFAWDTGAAWLNLGVVENLSTAARDALTTEVYNGKVIHDDTLNQIQARISGTWYRLHHGVHTLRHAFQWIVPKEVKVPSGDTDYIPGVFIMAPSSLLQTANIVALRHRINGGTSVTVKMQQAGSDVTGFTGVSVTTTTTTTDPSDQPLTDLAYLAPVVTAVSGTPINMTLAALVDTAFGA